MGLVFATHDVEQPTFTGTVKEWNDEAGVGKITPDDVSYHLKDVSCWINDIQGGNALITGGKVTYQMGTTNTRGTPCAINVSGAGVTTKSALLYQEFANELRIHQAIERLSGRRRLANQALIDRFIR